MNGIVALVVCLLPLVTIADLAPMPFEMWQAQERMRSAFDGTKMCASVVGPSFMQCFVVLLVMVFAIQVMVLIPRREQRVPFAICAFSWLLALVDATFVTWFGRSVHDFYAIHCGSGYGICWLLVHLVWFVYVLCRCQPRHVVSSFVVLLWFAAPLCAESIRMLLETTEATVRYEPPNLSGAPTEAEVTEYRRYIERDREMRERRNREMRERAMREREMQEKMREEMRERMRERMRMKPTVDSFMK